MQKCRISLEDFFVWQNCRKSISDLRQFCIRENVIEPYLCCSCKSVISHIESVVLLSKVCFSP